jgi:hypothetical protein
VPRLEAVHLVQPSEWPPRGLSRIRRRKRLSRHAAVVAWTSDPAALQPLVQAGFILDYVLTPEQALVMLAAERAGRGQAAAPAAWVALSRGGAAIIVVRGRDVLYARRIGWRYRHATRLNDQLLQRYTLVSHLAPELAHAIRTVRAKDGAAVESAVTCGDLPELRSLIMALIEELDLEVETLDTADGIDAPDGAIAQVLVEHAPALRLATTVAALPIPEGGRRHRWWGRAVPARPTSGASPASDQPTARPPVQGFRAGMRP